MKDKKQTGEKIERCGYCGRYFVDNKYLCAEELKEFTEKELKDAPLGYGPDARSEHYEQNPDDGPQIVTRDMAIDAGMPEIEGMIF